MQYGYHSNKQNLTNRLHRIEGQIRGVESMIEKDTYCIDILTQVGSIKSALDAVSLELLRDHVSHCMDPSVKLPNKREDRVDELLQTIKRLR